MHQNKSAEQGAAKRPVEAPDKQNFQEKANEKRQNPAGKGPRTFNTGKSRMLSSGMAHIFASKSGLKIYNGFQKELRKFILVTVLKYPMTTDAEHKQRIRDYKSSQAL